MIELIEMNAGLFAVDVEEELLRLEQKGTEIDEAVRLTRTRTRTLRAPRSTRQCDQPEPEPKPEP